jgi:hypothetical protein
VKINQSKGNKGTLSKHHSSLQERNNSTKATTQQGQGLKLLVPADRLTVVEAQAEVSSGNSLYIRGQGQGLSWHKGQPLKRSFAGKWIWTSSKVKGKLFFRLLLNDRIWDRGDDVLMEAGKMIEVAPVF